MIIKPGDERILKPGAKPRLPIVTGVLTVDKRCRWFGKAVLHGLAECECQNIPEHYVNVTPDGAPYNSQLVGIVRDVGFALKKGTKRSQRVTRADVRFAFAFQCRICWPKDRSFKSEDGAVQHLRVYHGVEPKANITEVMVDVLTSKR